ncbi:MAG: outer membrane protein transport protein [Pseudomonadota bacterium]
MKNVLNKIALTIFCAGFFSNVFASDFNIPFVSASGLGNLYADWATNTEDSSNAFTNPAGLTELHHREAIIAPIGIFGSTQFQGTTTAPPPPTPLSETGKASSRFSGFIPATYFAFPINNQFTVGISLNAPFGLGTNYPKNGVQRYQATRTQVVVADLSPSIGFQVTREFSVGLGVDINRLAYTLNNMVRSPFGGADWESQNHLRGYALGWHGGLLYQVLPKTRLGLSFNSMVAFHTTGDSILFSAFGEARTANQKTYARLPARTQFSIHQDINDRWAVMGTVFYTNWATFHQLTQQRVVVSPTGATAIITIPFNFHNTFDYVLGLNFKATDKVTLKTGIEFMNAPSANHNRGVADPVAQATVFGVGAHYQHNKTSGYDFGIAHSFFIQNTVNVVTPFFTLTGQNQPQTTVVGLQWTYNFDGDMQKSERVYKGYKDA